MIGIKASRQAHILTVARLMEDIARNFLSWPKENCWRMFLLGYVHDIGYEVTENQRKHGKAGGKLLKASGYIYWLEVYWHGDPEPYYLTDELMLLNMADMRVNSLGEIVSIEKRLSDIESRYGEESDQYKDAAKIAEMISEWCAQRMAGIYINAPARHMAGIFIFKKGTLNIMQKYIDKCECCIHSLNGELREATILERIGDNKYLADYNGVKCTAIFNPFMGRYYVDDKYGVIKESPSRPRGQAR